MVSISLLKLFFEVFIQNFLLCCGKKKKVSVVILVKCLTDEKNQLGKYFRRIPLNHKEQIFEFQ